MEQRQDCRSCKIEDKEATATFHFFDHTEEEVRQLVGTLLHAPENTPGYYWDPEVPETMPAEDITVNAVRQYIPGGGGGSGFE